MSNRKLIGRVSATEKYPSSCDDFQFWLSDDAVLSPFDIVRVENKADDSVTYGVVQDILHITDGTGHLSNYVSSDFGNVDTTPLTRRLSLSYAKVSVIHNTKENFMPVFESSPVYTADNDDIEIALGLDNIDEKTAIPAGLMKASNNISVPIKYNGDFLIGPEGAHMNISGISGLATKTSYVMFLLKAIQHKYKDDVAIIVMNVKGDDLLHVHQPNEKMTPTQREEWDTLGVPCKPFENVKYLYPYRNQKDKLYANTALPTEDLAEQFVAKQAANFVYTFEHDIDKVDMLFSNVDDPNYTIESILNYIDYGQEFRGDLSWTDFKDKLKDFCSKGSSKNNNSSILIQSWQRFRRLINNSINDDIFVNAISSAKEQHQVYLSNEVLNINGGEMMVVDIAGLTEQLQCLVFGDIIRSVYSLKHGDFDQEDRYSKKPVPKRVVIFVDELNKYAPSTSSKNSPLLANLLDITERGRSEGVVLFSAEQFRSAIHERIKGNCGTNVYGRTNAIEVSRPDYKFVPTVYANMMTRLKKGDLILHHPVFKTLLKIQFPFPSYNQGGSK
ncbi:ATP-binding protein [Bacilliculturomica massiliensis]|uniref:ATP-binding protein n=1 Tax=Bacilliculturomica massiliensis TaxID=1917867 RepID=UPI001030A393|nr:ATP-binding protein [Bacilliculturomica massiliensis]